MRAWPKQARAELRPEALAKMRLRFVEAMWQAYGARDLDDIFDYMDVMLVPIQTPPPHTHTVHRPHRGTHTTSRGTESVHTEGAP